MRKETPGIMTMHPCDVKHFPTTVKQFTRNKLWMMDEYQIKGTIGYNFFTYYQDFLHMPTIDEDTKVEIWNEAKDYIEEALAAKWNAVQTAIKKTSKASDTNIFLHSLTIFLKLFNL